MITTLPEGLYEAAVDLWRLVGLTRPWNDPHADLVRAVTGTSSTVLALIQDEALVGTAMVGTDGHRAWMYYLAVDPAAQGSGHGRALVRSCEQWAVAHGAPKLMLMVRSTNEAVLGFYASLGYQANEVATLGKFLTS